GQCNQKKRLISRDRRILRPPERGLQAASLYKRPRQRNYLCAYGPRGGTNAALLPGCNRGKWACPGGTGASFFGLSKINLAAGAPRLLLFVRTFGTLRH